MDNDLILKESVKNKIISELRTLLKKTIRKFDDDKFWNPKELNHERPFHTSLVKSEYWKGSKFERSFTTVLGQTVFENIAFYIAEQFSEKAIKQKKSEGSISIGSLSKINQILNELEHKSKQIQKRTPNWDKEVQEVLDAKNTDEQSITIISDLYFIRDSRETFIEIKSSKPNADQTRVSKEKILKLQAMYNGQIRTLFALPDNPYLTRAKYNWPHPQRYFDMKSSSVVLIGKEFWDYIGCIGVYEELLEIFKDVGREFEEELKIFFTK